MLILRHTSERLKNFNKYESTTKNWKIDEDKLLLKLVESFPKNSWKDVKNIIPGKKINECKKRHKELMNQVCISPRKNGTSKKKSNKKIKMEQLKKIIEDKENILFPTFYFLDQLEIFQNFPKLERTEEIETIFEKEENETNFPDDLDYFDFYALSINDKESTENTQPISLSLKPLENDLFCEEKIFI